MDSSSDLELQVLSGEQGEMAELQRVLEAAPAYAHKITGLPVGSADALSTFSALPPGKTYDDKFVFGIRTQGRMIGCIDLIRGWPEPATAHIGLLLLREDVRGQRHGRRAVAELESFVRAWGTCSRVRAGVVMANAAVLPFWERLGFRRTGETRPYRYGPIASEVVIVERRLEDAA